MTATSVPSLMHGMMMFGLSVVGAMVLAMMAGTVITVLLHGWHGSIPPIAEYERRGPGNYDLGHTRSNVL